MTQLLQQSLVHSSRLLDCHAIEKHRLDLMLCILQLGYHLLHDFLQKCCLASSRLTRNVERTTLWRKDMIVIEASDHRSL